MIIGSAWTKDATDGGKTKISIVLDDAVLEMFPQLKNVGFSLKYVSKEERKSDKSPGWTLLAYKKEIGSKDSNESANTTMPGEDEIPF